MFLNKIALFPWKHNKTTNVMAEQTMEEEAAVNLEQDLLPCFICGRTFLPTPLAKHTKVCEKNATRKRKVFDSLKQRVEGTDLAPFHQKSYLKKADTTQKGEIRQSKWKEKHLELVNAIRAAKGTGTSPSAPPTMAKRSSTTLGTPTHERCPSCDRQFGPKAFDRHVEWCKDKRTTIHKSPASVVLAKERLEARTKYKVPPLTKSRRAVTREKYSPQIAARPEPIVNVKSVSSCTLDRSPSVRRSKNFLHGKKSADKMAEGADRATDKALVKEKVVERTVGDVKVVQSEKNLQRDVKKSLEPIKSTAPNKRLLLFSKINTISVNEDVAGLTVSHLSIGGDTRKLVTWKDTVREKQSSTSCPVAFRSVNSPSSSSREKPSTTSCTIPFRAVNSPSRDRNTPPNMETFGNIVAQSRGKKESGCGIKVIVKEKKVKKEKGGGEKMKVGGNSSRGVALKKSSPVKKNVCASVRSLSGHKNKTKSSTMSLKVDMTDLYSDKDESSKEEVLIPIIPIEIQDSCNDFLLTDSLLELPPSTEEFCDDSNFSIDNYRDELTSFKDYLLSIEASPYDSSLQDYFQEGEMLSDAVDTIVSTSCDSIRTSRQSSRNEAQNSPSMQKQQPNSKSSSPKVLPQHPIKPKQRSSKANSTRTSPRKSPRRNHQLKSCSDAFLIRVPSPRIKLPVKLPKSTITRSKSTPRRISVDKASKSPPKQRRKDKNRWYKCHRSHSTSPKRSEEILPDNSSEKVDEDTIETQYQKCKALHDERKLAKVNSEDVGVSCLTRFRRDTKIATCRRFLEKNQLVEVNFRSPVASSSKNLRSKSRDQCCQTPSIEGLTKTTIDPEDLKKEYVPSFRDTQAMANGEMSVDEARNKDGYFDSLDGSSSSSVNSVVCKAGDTSVCSKAEEERNKLKEKTSKSNMLYVRRTEDCFSEDSVIDGCENYHSHALSVARIERGLRRCSSDICLRKQSETSFVTYTETDLLRKLSSYECTSIQGTCEEANLTSDEILEIAGEQFLQCLKNSSTIKTSTPISGNRKPRSPYGELPLKRRRLEELKYADEGNLESVYAVELRCNIQQIKEAKMRMQMAQTESAEECKSAKITRNSGIIDDVVSQVQVDGLSEAEDKDCVEMKRILSTIEEASSNTSSGMTNKHSRNRLRRNIHEENRLTSDSGDVSNAGEGDWCQREDNLIDLDGDGPEIPNGFRYMACHYEILEPERVSPPPIENPLLQTQAKSQNKHLLKPKSESADVIPNLSPRFLHLIRTIIHPQGGFPVRETKRDAEEEFLKISRAHCRKLLQLDKRRLNYVLESEPLRLPQIDTVGVARTSPSSRKSKKIIKLPQIAVSSPCNSATRCVVKIGARKSSKHMKLPPLVLKADCGKGSKIPVKGLKSKSTPTSESSFLERSVSLFSGRNRLPPRPNSLHVNNNNNNNAKFNSTTTLTDNLINKSNKINTNNNHEYNPFISAERQLMELLECDDFKDTPTAPPPTLENTPRPRTTDNTTPLKTGANKSPFLQKKLKSAEPKLQTSPPTKIIRQKQTEEKRASVIDPPADFRDRLSMLNDDFDAIESMINSAYSVEDAEHQLSESFKFYARAENNSFNLNAILSQRKYSDDLSSIDPRLINENDNLSIPESLHDDSSPASTLDNNFFELSNRMEEIDHFSENFDHKMSSIEPDGTEIKLKGSISTFEDQQILESGNIDEFVIALNESKPEKAKSTKNTSKNTKKPKATSRLPKSVEKSNQSSNNSSFGYSVSAKDKKKNNLASLKRSISLLDPVQKPKPLKNKQDVQNYFNEQELKSPNKSERAKQEVSASSRTAEEEISVFMPKAEELFSVDDEMYEEYKKYEEMYLKEKEEKMKRDERRISDGQSGLLTASEDDDSQQQTVKLSGDSAYGSLNRKTPKVRARSTKLTPLESQRNLAIDSPSSSSSESSPPAQITLSTAPKMSKFCHECGNRYPVNTAKFCVECGVRRLVL